jgi:hypothetical protein
MIFNLGNLLLVAAILVAGMAVAFPLGASLALVIGAVLNYIVSPAGKPVAPVWRDSVDLRRHRIECNRLSWTVKKRKGWNKRNYPESTVWRGFPRRTGRCRICRSSWSPSPRNSTRGRN